MDSLQKPGGIAALIHAATYVVGITLGVTLLFPIVNADPGRYVSFLAANRSLIYIWNLISYWGAAIALVVMALALHERLRTGEQALVQVATAFGLIWAALIIGSCNLMLGNIGVVADLFGQDPATAKAIWPALQAMENGLVTGNELVGSLWVLLLTIAAIRNGRLGKALNCLGLVTAGAGILTIIPVLVEKMMMVFAPGMIIWSVWVGIVMLRGSARPTAVGRNNPSV